MMGQISYFPGEFEPNQSSSDDEETIARAEAEDVVEEQNEEVKLLALESTLPLDDVIKSLPPEVREAVQRSKQPVASTSATLTTAPKSEPKEEPKEEVTVLLLLNGVCGFPMS